MNTQFLLLAQYGATAIVPVEDICRDYFRHLKPPQFIRNVNEGNIALPLTRIDGSAKTAMGVHVNDLAAWIDARAEAARKECRQMNGRG